MPIRWRLTLWFSLILLVILVFSGVVLNTILRSYLFNTLDDNLRAYSARVHGSLSPPSGPLDFNMIHDSLPQIIEFSFPSTYLEIIDTDGKVIIKSDNLGNQELPVDPVLIENSLNGLTDIHNVAAGDNIQVRIMVSPIHLTDRTLVLEIAQSTKPIEDALLQFRLALLISSLTALILTAILGSLLVSRTLESVKRVTRTARDIEGSSDLRRRVGYKGPQDEIGQLATTFDRMIDRLERAFESQKHFVTDASHELRTPLTVIQGNLDLLKRNMGEEDRKESLRAIESETKRMTKIAGDLLLLANVEAGQTPKPEEISLKRLVTDEIKRAQLLAGNRKILTGPIEDLKVKGDSYRLNQVISNLVDNAIKYTPEGGTITLSLFRDGDWARLEVADSGIGIEAENLPNLFDRFYRVDKARSRAKGGSGLGLAIVKGIVEQHGGKVTVTSQPGKGSAFTVWLKL